MELAGAVLSAWASFNLTAFWHLEHVLEPAPRQLPALSTPTDSKRIQFAGIGEEGQEAGVRGRLVEAPEDRCYGTIGEAH